MAPKAINRLDYKPTPFLITHVDLDFDLRPEYTTVISKLRFVNNADSQPGPVLLNGRDDMKLTALKLNGQPVLDSAYKLTHDSLTILEPPDAPFEVEVTTEIQPENNTLLEGLYMSQGNYCTQCEAEGFRGITYSYDRPDVMSIYTCRIEADAEFPVLLSNGNLVEEGKTTDGRHYTVWHDPFPKPSYLFALVAGQRSLSCIEDTFKTVSGKEISLRVYTDKKDIGKTDWAMESLKKAMTWDEQRFGLEYDLDQFNIVAVPDFVMGAMENKSLNIFNSRLILASPETATDVDYSRIEGVVAHEYFHNWTGNRVTCRDWFQLTLKEGLTVFRDQEFTSDMRSRAVKRIEDVAMLRGSQMPEDEGPMSHPIRPDSVLKFDNFYSRTVYEKGAEIIRIYDTVLGQDGFRRGMDLYFERHDGHAVTCNDFLRAMEDANHQELSVLSRWYSQAGTPRLTVSTSYDAVGKTFTVRVEQHTPPTLGQAVKEPVLIPLTVGLLDPEGKEMPLKLQGSESTLGTSTVLRIETAKQEFVFEGVYDRPVPSLLRNFSAPVKMTVVGQTSEDLAHILAYDTDPFNRWDAAQRLARNVLLALYQRQAARGGSISDQMSGIGNVPDSLISAMRAVLSERDADGAFIAAAISLPTVDELIDSIQDAEPLLLHAVRVHVGKQLAKALRSELEAVVAANEDLPGKTYSPEAAPAARRAAKNKALGYLSMLGDAAITANLLHRFQTAQNMTDQVAVLAALNDTPGAERDEALTAFYKQFEHDPLVRLKWLALRSASNVPANLGAVDSLQRHPSFDVKNPNCCYSLYLGFARSPLNFHASNGSGYKWFADSVLKVDRVNRQVASRMVSVFNSHAKLSPARSDLIQEQLRRIQSTDGLSDNVLEIVNKALAAA